MSSVSRLGLLVLSIGAFGCAAAPKSAAPPPPPGAVVAIPAEKKAETEATRGDEKKKADEAEEADKGNLWGDTIGDSFGAGGLGLAGVGEGGGGRGEGIGIGSAGTIGHGAGTGTGQGYGSGSGRMGGAHKSSTGKVSAATATTVGTGLPPEVIQRIVRSRIAKIRYCYEKALERSATLSGKVAVKFTIDAAGAVTAATASDTTIADAEMVSCVVAAVRTLSFPQPDSGSPIVVTYPFNFAPADP